MSREEQIKKLQEDRARYLKEKKKINADRRSVILTAYDECSHENYVTRKAGINQAITNISTSIEILKKTDF